MRNIRGNIRNGDSNMIKKFWLGIRVLLIAIDQLFFTVFGVFAYWMRLMKRPPNPDDTISSHIGKRHKAGKAWAKLAMPLVDGLFYFPEGKRMGHCYRAIEDDE